MGELKPTVVVAGLGRCGTSVAMQMLHFGGLPCVGEFPSFEDERTRTKVSPEDIEAWRGSAVKVLDPHIVGLPGDVRVIWMRRDHGEQVSSMSKFNALLLGIALANREQRRRMEKSLTADRVQSFALIGRRPLLVLDFEALLASPAATAERMAEFVAPVAELRTADMARCVLKRSPKCMPNLLIETALVSIVTERSALQSGATA